MDEIKQSQIRKVWPILLVDDEWDNIADLEGILTSVQTEMQSGHKKYELPYMPLAVYAAHPEQAVREMIRIMESEGNIGAIISDNHLKDSDVDGDDFLRILQGYPGYCASKQEVDLDMDIYEYKSFEEFLNSSKMDENILQFLEYSFGEIGYYQGFKEYFFGLSKKNPKLIMLCGNPKEVDRTGLDDIEIVHKGNKNLGASCEQVVLGYLAESEILPSELVYKVLENHHRLGKGVHPNHKLYHPRS